MPSHRILEDLPPKLDVRVPPDQPRAAEHYADLVQLLEELGHYMDQPELRRSYLIGWETRTADTLRDDEIDLLMRPPDEDEPELRTVFEQRWRNLLRILLRRKGVG